MNKKAQVKMFESIAILVVFFIILMFGFVFYTKIQKSSMQLEFEEINILKAVDTAEKISFLPEFQCIGNQNTGCIDKFKVRAAEYIIQNNPLDYIDIFGNSIVTISEVYSSASLDPDFPRVIYDYPKERFNGKISTQFPVSLYDPLTDTYSFGVLDVGVYR